jgi:hypothetical protein
MRTLVMTALLAGCGGHGGSGGGTPAATAAPTSTATAIAAGAPDLSTILKIAGTTVLCGTVAAQPQAFQDTLTAKYTSVMTPDQDQQGYSIVTSDGYVVDIWLRGGKLYEIQYHQESGDAAAVTPVGPPTGPTCG